MNHPDSFCGGMFKLNAKFDAVFCPTHSVILNETVHMLTQRLLWPPLTSTVKSSLVTHVHSSPLSSWLPGYVDVTQTILIILTMVGLFPDRQIYTYPFPSWKRPNSHLYLKEVYDSGIIERLGIMRNPCAFPFLICCLTCLL